MTTSLILIAAVAITGAIGKRLEVPLPFLFIIAGVLLSFLPQMASFSIHPEIFFVLFIPPLLFADGWQFPKREFLSARYSILLLAFGLVFFTILVVGYAVHWMIPSIPLAAAFALGAVISPTDAVAVAEITQKLKLPMRMQAVLNGESLINDASGLVAFKFAVAAVLTGTFSLADASLSFLLLAGGGTVIGLLVAFVIQWVRRQIQLHGMEDPTIQTALSLITPFVAYIAADQLKTSGIMAVVAAGIYAGVDDNKYLMLETRRKAWSIWETLLYLFNGLVFLMLGLQTRQVLSGIGDQHSWVDLLTYAVALGAVVVIVRLVWIFPFSRIAYWLNRIHAPYLTPPPWRYVFVTGWAGIRGAVTLAAALSIPLMAGDRPFPERDLIIFLATSVIISTLAVNGLTLRWMLRMLKIEDDGIVEREERAARIAMAHRAIERLRNQLAETKSVADREFAEALIRDYERRIDHIKGREDGGAAESTARIYSERAILMEAINAERDEMMALRRSSHINEQALFAIQRDLDLREATAIAMAPACAERVV